MSYYSSKGDNVKTDSKYFFGVVRSSQWAILKPGDRSYWCIYQTYSPATGDWLVLYRVGRGVNQIYKTIDNPSQDSEINCEMRGMATIPIELVLNLENPITAKELKADPVIGKSGPVGRNFQGTCFSITLKIWDSLLNLISLKNPRIASQVERIR